MSSPRISSQHNQTRTRLKDPLSCTSQTFRDTSALSECGTDDAPYSCGKFEQVCPWRPSYIRVQTTCAM